MFPRISVYKYCFRYDNGPRMPPLIRRPRGLTNSQIAVGVSKYLNPTHMQKNMDVCLLFVCMAVYPLRSRKLA